MFTKQHIDVFVTEILNTSDRGEKLFLYTMFNDLLIRHCPRFNKERFHKACYPNEDK